MILKIKKNMFIIFTVLLILIIVTTSIAIAADIVKKMDLDNYPNIFITNDRLDVTFVVGEFAISSDVLATVDIASSLQENLKDTLKSGIGNDNNDLFEIDIEGDAHDELTSLYMDVFNKKVQSAASTVLDTSLSNDSLADKNLIIVGGPCVNWVAASFHGFPENCAEGYLPGRGYVELFRNGKGIAMVVAGYSAEDTRIAANIVSHYKDYSANFVGTKLRASNALIQETSIE